MSCWAGVRGEPRRCALGRVSCAPQVTGSAFFSCLLAIALLVTGCQKRPARVPGETDVLLQKVEILPAAGQDKLSLPVASLLERLGERPAGLVATPRRWSEFREAEDRRRIEA